MKKFTCTETSLKFTHADTGALVTMEKDDTLSLPDAQVDELCRHGWGTADGVTTGERKPGVVKIEPPKTVTKVKKSDTTEAD